MSYRKTAPPRPERARRASTRCRIGIERLEDRQLLAAGTLAEYQVPWPSSYPRSIGLAPDGSLWFSDIQPQPGQVSDTGYAPVGRITTAGVVSELAQISPYHYTSAITEGPDGNLWIAEELAIARIGP